MTDSLISGDPVDPDTSTTPAEPDTTPSEPVANDHGYDFDFKGQDIQTGAEVDITKDPVYEKMIPVFKEMNLSQDQAQAMLSGYMNKTYNAIDGLSDDEGMIFGKYKDAVAAQDAFKKLESENGRLRREKQPEAPDEYSWEGFSEDEDLKDIIPEDFDFADDPLVKYMDPVFKEGNFTQDQVRMATKAWLKFQSENQINSEEELKALGSEAKDLVAGAQSFRDIKGFSDEEKAIIEGWAATGSELRLINKIREMVTAEKKIPTGDKLNTPIKTSSELYAEANELRRKPHFASDPDLQAVYEKKMDAAVLAEEKGL